MLLAFGAGGALGVIGGGIGGQWLYNKRKVSEWESSDSIVRSGGKGGGGLA